MEDLPASVSFEEERLTSFKNWPFKKGPCCPEKMAEAGFYCTGGKSEPDLAKCYVCFKELDGWEKDDDPWLEHKKHAPKCPFVTLEKKPMDLTVKDINILEVKRIKTYLDMELERKVKMLQDLQTVIVAEIEKVNSKGGKENQKKRNIRTKRSSRKD